MTNWTGTIRDFLGTLRSIGELSHWHLLRMRLRHSKSYYRYARPLFASYVQTLYPAVPVIPFTDALRILKIDPESLTVSLPHMEGYVGLADWDRVALASISQKWSNRPIFEIGTAEGSSAILLAQNSRQLVFTLDLPVDSSNQGMALPRLRTDDRVIANRQHSAMLRERRIENVVQLFGDSATFDFSPYRDGVGLFFIDGAHSFEYVRSDSFHASNCCCKDGVIIWDDFGSSRDVSRFLDWLAQQNVAIYGIAGTTLAFTTDIAACRRAFDYSQ